ncbi:uncharacterized protein EI97DRAFT_430537 [Westerdykella ornata]|uniref:tRNA(Ile)-lysidine synthetase n=1 Tax=Westerdykella ornata TaxID=318751 RepID=A0A6A6JUH1_WESOR|nr:uncharacterized protein EI97DRAFT_430537 [Westerdykella ornata]KAF2279468.1 hypothetical protein EI97DRAFT_430537 [Westerdykella ornata]
MLGWYGVVVRRGGSAVKRTVAWGRAWEKRWYSSVTAEPVSREEFARALDDVYPHATGRTMGLAISGGVDSMALATLYTQSYRMDGSLAEPHAIIIDHKVRLESTEEAEWVAEQLREKLQIPSTIIPLTWPDDVDPRNLQKFESVARRLRYQALGLTCRDHGINALLVAHHGDDQAETIMMRLVKGRLRSGLQGMHSVEWIPECHGIHGVHHSGDTNGLPLTRTDIKKTTPNRPPIPFLIEKGGIQILRPLLTFEKSRLIATCQANSIPWAEDKTNHIPTFTTRNAVRHILQNHHLPEALTSKSLISLAQRMQRRVESHRQQAEKIFDKTPLALDIQTGSLIVRFPPASAFLASQAGDLSKRSDRNAARNTAFLYLQRVAELVSPKDLPSIGQLSAAVDHVWPALRLDENETATTKNTSKASPSSSSANLCVLGIWFRRNALPSRARQDPTVSAILSAPSSFSADWYQSNTNEEDNIYLLSRQPLDTKEKDSASLRLTIPNTSLDPSSATTWHLFDDRFWLRVENRLEGGDDVVVRMLTDEEVVGLLSSGKGVSPSSERREDQARVKLPQLGFLKPADLRTTIPALFRRPRSSLGTGSAASSSDKSTTTTAEYQQEKETLLALPTLGVRVPSVSPGSRYLKWEVRYKKISVESSSREMEDVVLPWSWRRGWLNDTKQKVGKNSSGEAARGKKKEKNECVRGNDENRDVGRWKRRGPGGGKNGGERRGGGSWDSWKLGRAARESRR